MKNSEHKLRGCEKYILRVSAQYIKNLKLFIIIDEMKIYPEN
jgi:hypothetical protein